MWIVLLFFLQLSFKTSLSIYSKAALRLALGAVRGAQQEHAGDEQWFTHTQGVNAALHSALQLMALIDSYCSATLQ